MTHEETRQFWIDACENDPRADCGENDPTDMWWLCEQPARPADRHLMEPTGCANCEMKWLTRGLLYPLPHEALT